MPDEPLPTGVQTTEFGALGERRELAPAVVALGRYLLMERIGRGGMGEVFRAHDPELDRPVAIKRLLSFSDDDQAQLRLAREGQAIAKLSHPNVVQVYDVGRDAASGDMFIAMELVEGTTLRQWLRTARSWQATAQLFAQAGAGLLAAHGQGIVHRDFKPENVLVADGPVAKVADFGLAKPASDLGVSPREPGQASSRPPRSGTPKPASLRHESGSRRSSGSAFDSNLTPVGTRLGTPAYMAPEQASGITTPAADQFSFAVALFEGFCGYLPFPADGAAQYAVAVLDGAMLEFPRKTAVPKRLQTAIYRALEVDPAARFATLEPLLAELRRDPAASRRHAIKLCATLALGGLATVATLELTQTDDAATATCARETDLIETVWNDSIRKDVFAAVAAVAVPFAADTAARTTAALDRTTASWVALRQRWCEAASADRAPSAVTTAVGACSDRMLSSQRELVASLLDADPDVLTNALDAIERTERELTRCEDPLSLAQYATDGDDDQGRRDALAVLTQTRQRLALGQSAAGLRSLDALILRNDPVIALEHNLLRAGLEKLRGNVATARDLLEQAARAGLGVDAPLLAAEWNSDYADLLYELGELDTMAAPYERAWALRRRSLGDEHIDTLVAQAARGHVPYARGEYDAALVLYRDAADRAAALFPATDSERAMLDEWVAQAMSHTGALEEARVRMADLVARLEQARGAAHPRTLDLLETLAMIELRAGHNAEALAHFQAALLGRASLASGGDPIARASTLANVGGSLSALERYDEAADALSEALELLVQAEFGPAHPSVIAIEGNLATIDHSRGQLERAIARFARLSQGLHAAGLELTSDGLMINLNYARALEDGGRRPDAVALLIAIVGAARTGSDHLLLGRAAQALAGALDRHGDPLGADEAIAVATEAFASQPADSLWRTAFEAFRRQRATTR